MKFSIDKCSVLNMENFAPKRCLTSKELTLNFFCKGGRNRRGEEGKAISNTKKGGQSKKRLLLNKLFKYKAEQMTR